MKYIRFFISSTFSDMERERNILDGVLTRLRNRYAQQGWVIEWIDLRWGISREATLDNRTMQICLEELERCRRLSPRPNFIILMGERYGWIPLPEVIPASEIDPRAVGKLDDFSRELFEKWYKLDENALPAGRYLLQPREDMFVDDFFYLSLVVGPMRQILGEISRGKTAETLTLSATAHEILKGFTADATNHTMVYRRSLTGIPQSDLPKYRDESPEGKKGLQQLRSLLDSRSNRACTVDIHGDYRQYSSGNYDEEIAQRMEQTLAGIIEKVVKERNKETEADENQQHIAMAAAHRGELSGRKRFVADAMGYIVSDERRPLVITAESGIGKSAVMRELVNRLEEKWDTGLVVRFCGETQASSEAWQLMDSVFNDLRINSKAYRDELQRAQRRGRTPGRVRLKRPWEDGFGSMMDTAPGEMLKYKLLIPTVLIIDAVDRVDDSQAHGFFDFPWLDVELPDNLKVIVTVTPDKIAGAKFRHARVIELPSMEGEAMEMVDHLLRRRNRTLSQAQWTQIAKKVEASDKSGIYLRVLADHLATLPSFADVSDIPDNLDSLLDYILDRLRDPSRHGSRMVSLALAAICATRLGLSDTEMRGIISSDNELATAVAVTSQHSMAEGAPAVPPIFWARLKADLENLLTQRYTRVGWLNTFSHQRIVDYVRRRILVDSYERGSSQIYVANYFGQSFAKDYDHALYERARLLRAGMIEFATKAQREGDRTAQATSDECFRALYHLLTRNYDYILNKLAKFRSDLIADYNRTLDCINPCESTRTLMRARNELMSVPKGDKMAQLTWILNMPDDTIIRELPKKSNPNLKMLYDRWRNNRSSQSFVHPIDNVGEQPQLAEDGSAVAFLTDHGLKFKIIALSDSKEIRSISKDFDAPVVKLVSDNQLHYHLFLSDGKVSIYDARKQQTIKQWKFNGKLKAYMSANGARVVLVYNGGMIIHEIATDDSRQLTTSITPSLSFISPSGRFLWSRYTIPDGEALVERLDLDTVKPLTFGNQGPIVFADEEFFISYNSDDEKEFTITMHKVENGRDRYAGFGLRLEYTQELHIWYAHDEKALYFQNFKTILKLDFPDSKGDAKLTDFGTQPQLLTVNGRYALRHNPESVVKWRQMLTELYVGQAFNAGINSFSVSADGRVAVMGIGVNEVQESQSRIFMVTDEGARMVELPFNTDLTLVTSVAVSPDGRYIGACSNWGELILVRREGMELIARCLAEGGCLSLQFSADSRRMLAVCDHFIASPNATIYIADTRRGVIEKAPGQLDWTDKDIWHHSPWPQGATLLTHSGRFAILGDFIWDIDGRRQVLSFDQQINARKLLPFVDSSKLGQPPVSGYIEHPSGQLLASSGDRLYVITLQTGEVATIPEQKTIAGVSLDGGIYYFIDADNKLYGQSAGIERHFANDIASVYPSVTLFDHLYAYTTDGYVVELNAKGEEFGRAYIPNLWHAIPTAAGLAVATTDGIMLISREG